MHEAHMHWIKRVLYLLEPVNLPRFLRHRRDHVFPLQALFAWEVEFRHRSFPDVGEDQPAIFMHGMTGNLAIRWNALFVFLCRSFGTAPAAVIFPAMVY